jgi:hypothetical protein
VVKAEVGAGSGSGLVEGGLRTSVVLESKVCGCVSQVTIPSH